MIRTPKVYCRSAMSATKISPNVLPHVSDTLGWILYKRGIHQRALALLKASAR